MKENQITTSLIHKVHELVRGYVKEGDVVVDATVGNGHDTLFLAKCVGPHGRVLGFDVQKQAIQSTRQRLLGEGGVEELHLMSHDRMLEVVQSGVSAVLFNLGYLPGSDKKTITQVGTTLKALGQALEILHQGGVLSVMCYPGHTGGALEAYAVEEWMRALDGSALSATRYSRVNASESSPFLLIAEKC